MRAICSDRCGFNLFVQFWYFFSLNVNSVTVDFTVLLYVNC